MGYKSVCFDCRKAYNRPLEIEKIRSSNCPQCGNEMEELYHLFQPPKQKADKKWKVVKYLFDNGFRYYHIWQSIEKNEKGESVSFKNYAEYPEKMKDAIEFVKKYKDQTIVEKPAHNTVYKT
jgi:hypothetical protein